VDDVMADVILDDLLQKAYNEPELVKEVIIIESDTSTEVVDTSSNDTETSTETVETSSNDTRKKQKAVQKVTSKSTSLVVVSTLALIGNKSFGIKKPKDDVGANADVARKGKRKMVYEQFVYVQLL
ncbi:hypothetical protein Tco_0817824, partial [Tanacetum coccineum]